MPGKVNSFVPEGEIQAQKAYAVLAKEMLLRRYGRQPSAFVHTYGCQGNVSDSERIKGQLDWMGFRFVDSPEDADLVLYNTCAVREHAEDRVFGNVGALKPIKEKRPDMIIALCGCMMQQDRIASRIKKSYPYVNIVFGTYALYRVPQMFYEYLADGKRVFDTAAGPEAIAEGIPAVRDSGARGWLPIMYGCNNFCTYCIVPYVRGRERSRRPGEILAEAERLIAGGVKDITLLGQNVNSYGKTLDDGVDFAALLRAMNRIPGDFIIRFMTSHPKDCTKDLLDAMAECDKVAHHLHLPVQSGSDSVLARMHRGYTKEKYLGLIKYAKQVMPDISLTSDIIVGFPGETDSEFNDTLSLVAEVGYTSLFTFIYSKRPGTPAAELEDPVTRAEKNRRFKALTDLQESIAAENRAAMNGRIFRTLVEPGEDPGMLMGRTAGNVAILFPGSPDLVGSFVDLRVTESLNWIVKGELVLTAG
ncbi:MAG: tRNA (N6-isopentenyl adenosine(37)-C2)-methylthiotransferase MiaB [Clostridia bacterium]|nr:tRNA (N6-isopentenyl adenosine(37)-C2)-methylthiotransferase MiaB [Clostridia bacterium]